MLDTIDLLETIGKNAALRHISGLELVEVLGRADASEALKAAAMAGDSSLLSAEFGDTPTVRMKMRLNRIPVASINPDDIGESRRDAVMLPPR
jgi:hypothetical protein